MKILYVEHISESHAQSNVQGMVKAYRKLGTVNTFDDRSTQRQFGAEEMNRRLLAKAVRFKPNFVHMGKCESVQGGTIQQMKEATGACVIHFYPDLRPRVKPYVADIGQYVDWTLLQHKGSWIHGLHRRAGCRRVGFWYVGTDPDVYYPRQVEKEYDAIFIGNPRAPKCGAERVELVRALADAGIGVHVFGGGGRWDRYAAKNIMVHGFVDQEKFSTVCSKAQIVLGYNAHDVAMYTSWRRPLNAMASGAFVLTRYFKGLETIFNDGEHLAWFKNVSKAVLLAHCYLADIEERQKIADAGRREVLTNHTWDNRIARMMEYAKEAGYEF